YNCKRQAQQDEHQQEFRNIKVKVNGVIVDFEMEVGSLREALNLPNFHLNGLPNFRLDPLPVPRHDMVDVDHVDD
ncbi:hypothetical protein BGZ99_009210, partial [Dissophora globulifera]